MTTDRRGATRRIKVAYILSMQRSGSTLLNRMLGEMPGRFSAGELRFFWHRGMQENQLCGCGQQFYACEFWNSVVQKLKTSADFPDPVEMAAINRKLNRSSNTPQLLATGSVKGISNSNLIKYKEAILQLYRTIQNVSGADQIIDSSKDLAYCVLLSMIPQIELHVIHLVRDSRAVAHSLLRKKPRPEILDRVVYMYSAPAWRSAIGWIYINSLGPLVRKNRIASYRLVRYDDLVNKPDQTMKMINTNSTKEDEAPSLHSTDNSIILRPAHTVAGNPMRFKRGSIQLRLDQSWLVQMPKNKKFVVSLLTFPLLWKYRFPIFRSAQHNDAAP